MTTGMTMTDSQLPDHFDVGHVNFSKPDLKTVELDVEMGNGLLLDAGMRIVYREQITYRPPYEDQHGMETQPEIVGQQTIMEDEDGEPLPPGTSLSATELLTIRHKCDQAVRRWLEDFDEPPQMLDDLVG